MAGSGYIMPVKVVDTGAIMAVEIANASEVRGPKGDPGDVTLLSGTGRPSSDLGVIGDFYIDTTAVAIYGPKTSGGWGTATSLIGPAGSNGSQGPAGPAGAAGANGTNGTNGANGTNGIGFQGVSSIAVAGPMAISATADVGKTFTNTGASVEVGFTLPATAPAGPISFIVTNGAGIRVNANTGQTIQLPGLATSIAGGYVESFYVGGVLMLTMSAASAWVGTWFGTWTVENS